MDKINIYKAIIVPSFAVRKLFALIDALRVSNALRISRDTEPFVIL
jgi:hypothetical protein